MGFAKENLDFNKNEDKIKLKISKMNNILQEIYKGGGEGKIKKHHDKGKLTARERIDALLDKNTEHLKLVHLQDMKCIQNTEVVQQVELL